MELFRRAHRQVLPAQMTDEASPLFQRIRDQAERCRRELSVNDIATMQVIWNDAAYALEVTQDTFEAACAPLIERLRRPVLQSLRDSEIALESLNEIVLVGGATRMPIVRRAVTRMFGRFPAMQVNPDEAVAIGAAIQGGLKGRDAQLREVVLTDVCPYSLGVAVSAHLPSGALQSGLFSPILERNTVVPASRESYFSTTTDNQTAVLLPVYQGESRNVADNIKLGELRIPVPARPAGQVTVVCRFSYDISGILEVDATVPATGESRQLVIVDDAQSMQPQEVEQRRQALALLKLHPREHDANRALMARLERCFEQSLGVQREQIGVWITQFTGVLESQNLRDIEQFHARLTQAIEAIDGKSFL
jgi:molecular chaperone HscC